MPKKKKSQGILDRITTAATKLEKRRRKAEKRRAKREGIEIAMLQQRKKRLKLESDIYDLQRKKRKGRGGGGLDLGDFSVI